MYANGYHSLSIIKTLNHQYGLYTKNKTVLKNNLIPLLDLTYPEVNALFTSPVRKDGHQKWVDFASTFWHVESVRSLSLNAFTQRYHKWCKCHGYSFSSAKATEIHVATKEQIAILQKDSLTKIPFPKLLLPFV